MNEISTVKIRKRKDIPLKYCVYDQDGNFVDYTDEFKDCLEAATKSLANSLAWKVMTNG